LGVRLHELVLLLGEQIHSRTRVQSIAHECGLSLATLALDGAPRDWWSELLRKAREARRLGGLLAALRRELPAWSSSIGEPEEWTLPRSGRSSHQPGGKFDPYWDIGREVLEQRHLEQLDDGQTPVVVAAPWGYGKTWYIERLRARFRSSSQATRALRAHADLFRINRDRASLLEQFAREIVKQSGGSWSSASKSWDVGSMGESLDAIWCSQILVPFEGKVLLTLDIPEEFWAHPAREEFFALVRTWLNNPDDPWGRLRIMVAYSTTPALWSREPTQSPLSVLPSELPDFSAAEILTLAARYELDWSEREVGLLREQTGGYPRLCTEFLHHCWAHREKSPESLLAEAAMPGGLLYQLVERHADALRSNGLASDLIAIGGNTGARPKTSESFNALHAAGFIRHVNGGASGEGRFELRFPLIRSVLKWWRH
jgi:AAA-like domain